MKFWNRLFHRHQREEELDEEIRSHLAMAVRERIEQGEDPVEAEVNARREFGNATLVKEVTRDMWGWGWLETLIQDLRYGLRQLRRNPGFAAVAVITLALGIGANTAMFSVVYGVLLRPLPYPHPERIVKISRTYRDQLEDENFTASGFDFWKRHSTPFQHIAASTSVGFNLVGAGRPERIDALRVSSQYFAVYGVQPFLGRTFSPDEDRLGGPNVAILNFGLWKEHFNGDPGAIGRNVLLDGAPYT
ncbi:MAG: ABC transporter permease, partial [Candidatus Acidiferrales bacterium]